MKGKRIFHTIRLCMIPNARRRALYLKKHNIFGSIGEKCTFMPRIIPLYPELIYIGDNVHFASNVHLVTHDIVHIMLNNIPEISSEGKLNEKKGKIVIGNNVFIGAGSRILYNVAIGNNVIIGAGSLVNKDIPSDSVAAGVPAKVKGSIGDFIKKRRDIRE